MLDIYCRRGDVIYILEGNVVRYNCWVPGTRGFEEEGLAFVDEIVSRVSSSSSRVRQIQSYTKLGNINDISEFNLWLKKYYFVELL